MCFAKIWTADYDYYSLQGFWTMVCIVCRMDERYICEFSGYVARETLVFNLTVAIESDVA